MNNWNFTGNLGRDADLRTTTSGHSVLSFTVAVKSGYGDKATTTWANCQLWGKQAESMGQYLIKGKQVGITGEVTLRQYQKQDGTPAQSLDVRVNDLTLLGSREEGQAAPRQPAAQQRPAQRQAAQQAQDDLDDDIPFN